MRRLLAILSALLFAHSLSAQDLQKGLFGCYSFSGNADDGSGHNRNGVVTGAQLTDDRFGNANSAYQFSKNNNIVVPPDSVPTTYWTYSAWVKFISFPIVPAAGPQLQEQGIVSSTEFNGLFLDTYYNQQITFITWYFNGSRGTGIESPLMPGKTSEWMHLVSVFNDGYVTLFVDGVQIMAGKISDPGLPAGQVYQQRQITIGSANPNDPGPGLDNLVQVIDDVVLYDRPLSDAEVQLLYENGLPCGPLSPPYVRKSYTCGSDTVMLTAGGGSNYRWYDAPSGGNLLVEGNPYRVVVPPGTTAFYVAKITNGIEGARAKVSVPSPSFPQLTCSIPTAALTNVPVSVSGTSSGGVLPLTYSFDFGDQAKVSIDSSSTKHIYAANGDYFITVTATDAHQCSATCSETIQVISLPEVTNSGVCSGSPATLTARGAKEYRWYDAETGGTLLSQQNPFVTPPLTSTMTYYVAALLNNDETIRTKVVVTPFAQPLLACTGSSDALQDRPVLFSATTTSGTPPFGFVYEINGVTRPSSSSPELSFQFTQPGNNTVELTVKDANQCMASCSQTVDVINIFIPNVITANGDALNDHLSIFEKAGDHYVPYTGSLQFSMTILNRYGKSIYNTTDAVTGWDGKGADAGVYYYELVFGEERFKGWVSVIK